MANPQKENGYTAIANEILENIYSRKFTANQLNILLVLWRYTYGFKRKDHDFSLSFISEITGLDRKAVKRTMDKLLEYKVVIVTKEATFSESRRLAFNKNYETWDIEKRTKEPLDIKNVTGGNNDHTTGGNNDHTTGGGFDHHERKDKEILINKKEEEEKEPMQKNPHTFYLENFGMPSSFIIESITEWCKDVGDEIVLLAMQEALKNGVPKYKYVETILIDWARKKLTDVSSIEKYLEARSKNTIPFPNRQNQEDAKSLLQRMRKERGI